MHELSEPDIKTLDELDLRIKIRETAKVDYAQFDLRVREACAAADELTRKCEELKKEGAHAFCTSSENIARASAKELAEKWMKAMPNADSKHVQCEFDHEVTVARTNGKAFSTLRLESILVGMADVLRQLARTKLLSDAHRQITGAREGGTVMWLHKPVYGSRYRGATEYSVYSSTADFEAAVAVILGGADPLTVQPILAHEVLPRSLAGGWSIFPAKKRKEKTILELRIWSSRAEANFETVEDAVLVMEECRKAAAQAAAQATAKPQNNGHLRFP